MDILSLVIIAVATLTAIAFKVYLYRRIKTWMVQDFIQGLAQGDTQKQQFLTHEHQRLSQTKMPTQAIHDTLTELAKNYSP